MTDITAAEQSQWRNLEQTSGKSQAQWLALASSQNFSKHSELVNWLKSEFAIGHGNANLIAHRAKQAAAGGESAEEDLLAAQYSGTKAANLAKYYAGMSYYRLKDYNKAIDYLKDFSTNAKQVQAVAYGSIGDAYSELKKNDDAIEYYKKAGTHFPEDEAISSEYLFRAASFLELNGKNDAAIEIYKQIKQNYPKSEKGFSIDKYINRLQVQP